MRCSSPSRFKPAAARMIASYVPSSSLRSRVCTLPRSGSIRRWGNVARNWLSRRRLEVPTRAPGGSAVKEAYVFDTNASRGSARSRIAPSVKPSGKCIGTSLSECTAISARPSLIASSSSFTNKPLPPIFASEVPSLRSPSVVMPSMLTGRRGYNSASRDSICRACHIASADSRVAITIRAGRLVEL